MTEQPISGQHIGDGAFIEWNGYAFVIFTDNGLQRTNEVYVEPEAMCRLITYAKALFPIAFP